MTAGYAVPGMPGMRAEYKDKDRACAISSSMSMSKSSASSDDAYAREGGNFKRVGLLCQSGQCIKCIKYPLSGKVLKYPDTFSRVQASIPVPIKEPALVSQFLIGKQVPPTRHSCGLRRHSRQHALDCLVCTRCTSPVLLTES